MPRWLPISEAEKIKINRKLGWVNRSQKLHPTIEEVQHHKQILANPMNYGRQRPTGRKRALNFASIRYMSRAIAKKCTSIRAFTTAFPDSFSQQGVWRELLRQGRFTFGKLIGILDLTKAHEQVRVQW